MYNVRSMSAADGLYVPVIVAGFVLVFMGLKSLTRGFKAAISESPSPPPMKKDDDGDLSSPNLEAGVDENNGKG